jgi:hypothetical protein
MNLSKILKYLLGILTGLIIAEIIVYSHDISKAFGNILSWPFLIKFVIIAITIQVVMYIMPKSTKQ